MTLILGVDPGKMTGWSVYDSTCGGIVDQGQLDRDEFVDYLIPRLEDRSRPPLDIACERFVIAGGTLEKGRTDENYSIEQVGILRHWARRYGHEFTLQGAGDAKYFANNTRLKMLGWHQPGRDHTNDALRHTLLRIAKVLPADLDRLLVTV